MTTEIHRRLFAGLSDLFTFIRSQEANKAVAAVTVEDLIQEQIKRNGEEALSNQIQYDPYSIDVANPPPQSQQPLARANFISGSDVNLPTRMDRLIALQNATQDLIDAAKQVDPDGFRDPVEEESRNADSILTAEDFEQIDTGVA